MKNQYTRFLNLMQAMKEATPSWPVLDAAEDRLLQLLAAHWHGEESVTVMDILNFKSGLSESTIHRRISSLQEKGVITLVTSSVDARYKVVEPTQLTTDYFAKLDTLL